MTKAQMLERTYDLEIAAVEAQREAHSKYLVGDAGTRHYGVDALISEGVAAALHALYLEFLDIK